MKASHVRLASLKGASRDRVYQLNWLKGCRWAKKRLEVQVVFIPEDSSDPQHCLYRWVRATDFPFLIVGSRWYRGVMVGKPLGLRRLRIPNAQSMRVHGLTTSGDPNKIDLAPAWALRDSNGNCPVLEFQGFSEGDQKGPAYRIFLPLSEAYRSHYFNVPVAIPSILGGLISGTMSNPSFEAWDPEGTHWIDRAAGLARITPARTLPQSVTKLLARSIFSEPGRASLIKIHRWIQSSFIASSPNQRGQSLSWLRFVNLPYSRAVWDASVVPMPDGADGRRRLLVLHIESFDAPEPFKELEIVGAAPGESTNGENGSRQGGGGMLLGPDPDDPIDNVDEGWDPQLEAVAVEDVISKDERAIRRVPRVVRPHSNRDNSTRPGERRVVSVSKGSTQAFGFPASGVAPLVFTYDDAPSEPRDSLRDSTKAIQRALASLVERHRRHGIEARGRLLPSESKVYEFRVPASDTDRAITVAVPRQFVIAEVCVRQKYAYVIEPERRSEHQPLPLGVLWLDGGEGISRPQVFSTFDLHRVVQHVESAAREGHSWIRRVRAAGQFGAYPVIHPPHNPPSPEALERFSSRIVNQLLKVIGDVAVVVG